jgi:hypothetical protein
MYKKLLLALIEECKDHYDKVDPNSAIGHYLEGKIDGYNVMLLAYRVREE